MSLQLDIHLVDSVGGTPVGGGTWQVTVKNNTTPLHATVMTPYQGSTITMTLPVSGTWTHASVQLKPNRYAPQGVTVNPTPTGLYRNNASAKVVLDASHTRLRIDLPLLRIREAPGTQAPKPPKPGDDLKAAELSLPKDPRGAPLRYREVHANDDWLTPVTARMVTPGPAPTAVLGDADAADWDRFLHRDRASKPATDGAPLLLEYGEVGSARGPEPTFLVGIWAPSSAGAVGAPKWRDMIAFYHPSTAKTWFPATTYPFRDRYPYSVTTNTQVLPEHPDHIFQPYVNLALKYPFGIWSRMVDEDRKIVIVMPVLPHPAPGRDPAKQSQDQLEFGLPFRTQSGMARLLAEVNLFLHQRRYGWSGTNLSDWWGTKAPTSAPPSPADATSFFPEEPDAPGIRRVAMAGFSQSVALLNSALQTVDLSTPRYSKTLWGVPDARKTMQENWTETWCLEPFLGKSTVHSAEFEKNLMAWLDVAEKRRFVLAKRIATVDGSPGALFPTIRNLSAFRAHRAKAQPDRFGEVWWGHNQRWIGMFCSNPYLSAAANVLSPWPPFEAHPSDDDQHAFMHVLAVGLALGWSTLGRA
ncbi:hypothetical protein [Streptomyces albogriseolus]|uniref:hypothetical protein n=1 Tax=Streptomyces albogriseolus TaxID=1887 RepID=UPI0036AB5328